MERMSLALTRMTPCSDCNEKFPEYPSADLPFHRIGELSGFRPKSNLNPISYPSTLNAFANDSNIAIVPPKKTFCLMSKRSAGFLEVTCIDDVFGLRRRFFQSSLFLHQTGKRLHPFQINLAGSRPDLRLRISFP